MSDEAYEVNGVPITSKPKRFRAGRSNNLGFQYAATNAAELAPVMVPDDNDLRFFAGEGEKSGAAGAMTATGVDAEGKKRNFEYRDHTADIQLHSWGASLNEALENLALSMFGYMTDLDGVTADPKHEQSYCIMADDRMQLVFRFLDELLFNFLEGPRTVCSDIRVLSLRAADPAQGISQWELRYAVSGEKFDLKKHACGTEVKAITYSAYKIAEENGRWDIYVIVDI